MRTYYFTHPARWGPLQRIAPPLTVRLRMGAATFTHANISFVVESVMLMQRREVRDVVERVMEIEAAEVAASGDAIVVRVLQQQRCVGLQACHKLREREHAVVVAVERLQ